MLNHLVKVGAVRCHCCEDTYTYIFLFVIGKNTGVKFWDWIFCSLTTCFLVVLVFIEDSCLNQWLYWNCKVMIFYYYHIFKDHEFILTLIQMHCIEFFLLFCICTFFLLLWKSRFLITKFVLFYFKYNHNISMFTFSYDAPEVLSFT